MHNTIFGIYNAEYAYNKLYIEDDKKTLQYFILFFLHALLKKHL